jgi:hypothetical protein
MGSGKGRLTASMSTGKRLEAISHDVLVRVLADSIRNKNPCWIEDFLDDRVDGRLADAIQVWVTTGEEVRPGFAKQQFHALGDHKSGCQRQRKTLGVLADELFAFPARTYHPAGIPLPQLPPPDERLGRASTGCRTRHKYHAHEEDNGGGDDEPDDGHEPCWNRLVVLVGKGYGEVDGGEGAFEGSQILPSGADSGDCATQVRHCNRVCDE